MRIEQEQVKVQNNRTNPNIKLNIQNTTIKESAAFSSVNVATNESILINKELKTKDEIMQEAGQINLDVKKKHMAVLSQTMTYDDFKQMNEDGYKCKDQSPEEVINTLDQIKAKLLQAGVVIEGYTDTLTDSELAMAVGDENFARAINQKLERYDLPKTMENQTQVVQAMEVAQTLQPLSNPSIEYLIKNNLEPTIQNLYIAQHSNYNNRVATQNVYYSDGETSYLSKKSANVLEETSLLQIKNILEKQNIPFSEDEQENLNYMVGADLPITEENIVYFQQLKNLELPMGKQDLLEKVVVSLANGNSAMDANLCHQNYYIEEGLNNYQKLQEMSIDDIEKQKQLKEIRLKLTLDASIQMSKCNITPDTTSIKEIIRFLTEYETTRAQELFSNDVEAQEKYSIYQTNLNTIAEVKEAPISILGNDIANINRVSIQTIADWSREKENHSSVQHKLLSYETIWTSPRKDMGDSLTKAVENSDVLLEGLGIEPSKESYRALQILAENQLEITTDAINNIMEFDSKLQTVLQNLTPDQVLRLVKEGINPIQMQLDEILTFVSEPMETDVKHNILAQDVNTSLLSSVEE